VRLDHKLDSTVNVIIITPTSYNVIGGTFQTVGETVRQVAVTATIRLVVELVVELLQWARSNGCDWSATTCCLAAAQGKLETLQWLHASGCPWDERVCLCAAAHGYLLILQWSRIMNCPWNIDECLRWSIGGQHIQVAEWIRAQQ
jgi:hypothetical protein